MRSYQVMVGPNPVTAIFIRGKFEHGDIHRRLDYVRHNKDSHGKTGRA